MDQFKSYFTSKNFLAVVFVALLLGIGIGYGLKGDGTHGQKAGMHDHDPVKADEQQSPTEQDSTLVKAGVDTLYICPMNCVAPQENPGSCPVCGMDLVPMSAGEHVDGEGVVAVSFPPEALTAAGIQVAPVEEKSVMAEIRLFGKIEYDPVEQYKVTAFAPGIIDRIYVKRAGQMVRRGDPLFDMHSSELFTVEQDLFEVLKQFPDPVDYRPAKGQIYKRQMRPPRRQIKIPKPGEAPEEEIKAKKAALQKLTQIQRKMGLLGLSQEDIERVLARGLPSGISTVTTPTTGVVQEQYAFKGSYVNTGETIFTIANPKYIWARLEGYAVDYPWIRIGQEAEFRVDAFPGETFKGKVQYLDPEFDPKTRTFKVGVLYTDPKKKLRPNMLVRCTILAGISAGGAKKGARKTAGKPPLVIPDTAPLITGTRAVVYVQVSGKPGTYETREVVLGPRARGYYVVKSGLEAGEMVVVNGNFKIDSAVQILAKPSMMEPHGGMTKAGHGHTAGTSRMTDMKPDIDMDMNTGKKIEPKLRGPQHDIYGGKKKD